MKEAKFFSMAALPLFAKRAMELFICIKIYEYPTPRISLSELWGLARIRDLLSITVKCKILKLSTKKMSGLFSGSPPPPTPAPPPPPKKKKIKKKILDPRIWKTDYSCIDFLHGLPFYQITACITKNVQITPINLELAAFQKHGGPRIYFFLIVLTRSNFDHYTRECGYGILKKKQNMYIVRPTAWLPLSGQLLCPPWGRTD